MAASHLRKRTTKKGITSWQIVVETGRDPITGKRERYYQTVNGTKKEAEAVRREMLNNLSTGGICQPSAIKLSSWMATWLTNYNPNIEATTRASYEEKMRNYIIPGLGHIYLNALNANHIQTWVNSLQQKGLSPRTIRNAFRNLSSALKKAVILRMLPYNPCEGVVLPRVEHFVSEIYDDEEILAVLEIAKGTDIYLLLLLGLALGLRRGELCALKWSHIDFKAETVNIKEANACVRGEVITKAPKSKTSIRSIPLGSKLCDILKEAMQEDLDRAATDPSFHYTGHIIHTPNGSAYHPDSLTQKWDRFMNKHNLKHIRLHDMRHSNASSLLSNGVDVKTTQARLGHADSRITLETYAHVTKAMSKKSANIVENVLFPSDP